MVLKMSYLDDYNGPIRVWGIHNEGCVQKSVKTHRFKALCMVLESLPFDPVTNIPIWWPVTISNERENSKCTWRSPLSSMMLDAFTINARKYGTRNSRLCIRYWPTGQVFKLPKGQARFLVKKMMAALADRQTTWQANLPWLKNPRWLSWTGRRQVVSLDMMQSWGFAAYVWFNFKTPSKQVGRICV